jgi:signal transduction histidine kinase
MGSEKMGKLTTRLVKYFIAAITAVVILCFVMSGMFLSIIYTGIQFSQMETASERLYQAVETGAGYTDIIEEYQIVNGFIIKNGTAAMLSGTRMGMMRNVDLSSLSQEGRYKNPMGEELLYYKKSIGSVDIIIFESNRFSSVYMKYTYLILGIIFFAALLISIPIVTFLGKRITNPVIMLQKASRDITNGNFEIDLDINTGDEIQELSDSIKTMAASLEKRDIMQRDFIANVTHDFKTPLSIIRNYSEAIYDDVTDEREKKEYLKVIMNEVDRLNYLVTDILQLSKLQSGKFEPHMENINALEL